MHEILQDYKVRVFWSPEDEEFVAHTDEFGTAVNALAESPGEAVAELAVVLPAVIETYKEEGWELPEPAKFSGDLRVRMPKSLHAKLFHEAEREGVSMNALLITKLAKAL